MLSAFTRWLFKVWGWQIVGPVPTVPKAGAAPEPIFMEPAFLLPSGPVVPAPVPVPALFGIKVPFVPFAPAAEPFVPVPVAPAVPMPLAAVPPALCAITGPATMKKVAAKTTIPEVLIILVLPTMQLIIDALRKACMKRAQIHAGSR